MISKVSKKSTSNKPSSKSVKRNAKRNSPPLPKIPKSKTASLGKRQKPANDIKRNTAIVPPCLEKETAVPVRNLDGNILAGVLHEPHKEGKTLVIAVHGFLSSKEQTLLRHACTELARAGYAAYRFDLSGSGDSEGRFEDATPRKMLRDISAVVEQFRRRYRRIVLLGHSLGASLALITAARAKVDGVIAIAPLAHPGIFADRLSPQQHRELLSVGFTMMHVQRSVGQVPYTITAEFVQEIRQLEVMDAARSIFCPVLLAVPSADATVPPQHAEDIMSVLHSKEVLMIGGASHNLTNPAHLDALIAGAVAWLKRVR